MNEGSYQNANSRGGDIWQLEQAAERGDINAMMELAHLYSSRSGDDYPFSTIGTIGGTYNPSKGLYFFEKAISEGYKISLSDYADFISNYDSCKALDFFEHAVASGDESALYRLNGISSYLVAIEGRGEGVIDDQAREALYEKAASAYDRTSAMIESREASITGIEEVVKQIKSEESSYHSLSLDESTNKILCESFQCEKAFTSSLECYKNTQGSTTQIFGVLSPDRPTSIQINADTILGIFRWNRMHGKRMGTASKAPNHYEIWHGKLDCLDGSIYEGTIVDDKPHGRGRITNPEGVIREGDFVCGFMCKQIKMILPNGNIYEGEFVNGLQHGKGRMTLADGSVCEGDFIEGQVHGRARYNFVDGSSYFGDVVDGYFQGQGIRTYSDGAIYEGEFAKDNLHGEGKLALADGSVYEGGFVEGVAHGKGRLTYPDGTTYTGVFLKGKPVDHSKPASWSH